MPSFPWAFDNLPSTKAQWSLEVQSREATKRGSFAPHSSSTEPHMLQAASLSGLCPVLYAVGWEKDLKGGARAQQRERGASTDGGRQRSMPRRVLGPSALPAQELQAKTKHTK